MKVIGLTGSIATGKSTVTNYLLTKGYIVLDSDQFAKDALTIDQDCINKVTTLFDCLEDGKINRKKLGNIIFHNQKAKKQLEDIIHPYVIQRLQHGIMEHHDEEIIFLDIPLLYESNLTYLCNQVVVVYCNKEQQLERLMNRDQIDRDYALQIMENQIDIEEKKDKADIVLYNTTSVEELYAQIDRYWKG